MPVGSIYNIEPLEQRTLLSGYSLQSVPLPPEAPNGLNPRSQLVADSAGDLFGTTFGGGTSGNGTVFEISHTTPNKITTLASFTGTDGENPNAGVILDSSGDLFGTTENGGSSGDGTVFEINSSSPNTITPLASFTGTNGENPYAGVTLDAAGDLFGTTEYGGSGYSSGKFSPYADGTVFEISHTTPNTITTLASFTGAYGGGTNGEYPEGGVTLDSAGDLFGTTYQGSAAFAYGTVFEIGHSTPNTITILDSFGGNAGEHPFAGLTFDSSGDLFGTTANGGSSNEGTVFEIPSLAIKSDLFNDFITLGSFKETGTEGGFPEGGVTLDSAGDLFGTTLAGGTSGYGTVFEIKSNPYDTITTLADFTGTNGEYPIAGVTVDASGDLFGTSSGVGTGSGNGYGTVFEINSSNPNTITTLGSFGGAGTPGANPFASVTLDSSGDLFGTTEEGGSSNDGTVFEISGSTPGTISTLANFTANGENPDDPGAGMTFDSAGDLFGTTYYGGTSEAGTVFEINHTTPNTITTLVNFPSPGTNGEFPEGGVTLDSAGDLFGTTFEGGSSGYGTVFEVSHTAPNVITTLASFTGTGGANPMAGVTLDSAGDLFGTTSGGGSSNDGTVFEISSSTPNTITTLASFDGNVSNTDGLSPYAKVTLDSAGDLFGTTEYGGASGYGYPGNGTVFEISHTTPNTITTLANFTGANGSGPNAGMTVDFAGDLFGTTSSGGASNDGTVFEIQSGTNTITTLADFTGTNGENPMAGVTLDSAGDLFGSTYSGGPSSDGTVFELTPAGTATSVSIANATATYGQSGAIALSATVAGSPTPSEGTVTFSLVPAGAAIASETFTAPVVDGSAATSISAAGLAVGSYAIQAGYSDPNGAYAGSMATAGTLVVSLPSVLNITSGTYTIAAGTGNEPTIEIVSSITIAAGATLVVASVASPASHLVISTSTFSNSGLLDLGGNDLVIQTADPAVIFNQLKTGFNGGQGYWNGTTGIVSSAAANDTSFLTTLGEIQSSGTPFEGVNTTSSSVLIKYTYFGDADLNGSLNGADYQQVDDGFGAQLSGWSNGDFNYDGVVDGSDYSLIDNVYNQLGATGAGPMARIANADSIISSAAGAASGKQKFFAQGQAAVQVFGNGNMIAVWSGNANAEEIFDAGGSDVLKRIPLGDGKIRQR